MTSIAAIILVLLGLGVTLGLVKTRRVGRFFVGLVFGPVLIGIGLTVGRQIFDALPPIQRVAFVVVVGLATIAVLLRIALPRDIWAGVVSAFIYDILKFLVVAPLRAFGWLAGRRGQGR